MENAPDATHRLLSDPRFTVGLLRRSLSANVFSGVAWITLAGLFAYREISPRPREYFFSNGRDKPYPMQPLSQPVVVTADLLDWAATAVRRTYAVNYEQCWEQWQEAQTYFTADAWKSWFNSFVAQKNLEKLQKAKMTARISPISAARVKQEGRGTDGRYGWAVEQPFAITYENANQRNEERLLAELLILRTDDPQHPRGCAIVQLVVSPFSGRT
jgi:intracellular multiplication protein IcmL